MHARCPPQLFLQLVVGPYCHFAAARSAVLGSIAWHHFADHLFHPAACATQTPLARFTARPIGALTVRTGTVEMLEDMVLTSHHWDDGE